ncbi:Protein LURP-one-related 7 [Cucurbita argyrosperma subsp. argyrosperma]|nr:Protein LURP-one-related 7 [Cucurbita argyrosperma subsp. argyrosperma]
MKGFPFQRSCTVYKGNAIVAQTSLMHKLHQICVRRGRFRLTIFPGTVDPSLIVALIVIFFDGRI